MSKKIYRFPWENLIVFLLFIVGFFIGSAFMPTDNSFLLVPGANSAMVYEEKEKSGKFVNIISRTIPLVKRIKAEEVKKEIVPINYTPDTPVLTRENSKNIKIKNDTDYEINIDEYLNMAADKGGKILILHTHTSEAYMMEGEDVYKESDPYRTQESGKNIIEIGSIIEKKLTERGIEVIHDKTYHDFPAYTGSYKRALETAEKILKENGDIKLVLDVHRDAILSNDGKYMKTYAEIGGEGCAQALIVIGTNGGGLSHDGWKNNLKYGLQLQKIMNDKYPEIVRPLHLCNERYNGHMSDGAMIIEIGSNANTLSEAKRCAALVGECIADFISGHESR